tara:strand:- start:299 stop:424 length:126 start_codon:yes stop_codon:yes gene_type:complete
MSHFGDLVFGKKEKPVVEPKVVEPKPTVTVKETPSEDKIKI